MSDLLLLSIFLVLVALTAVGIASVRKLTYIGHELNSRMSKFVQVAQDLARAQGITEGTATERQRERDLPRGGT